MAVEFYIHKMTEHMDTARIVRWLVPEGARVTKGQVILEVETEKAVTEVEAPGDGFLKGIRAGAEEGVEVKVGETIAFIAQEGESIPSLPPINASAEKSGSTTSEAVKEEKTQKADMIRATPSARHLAKEKGIDLAKIAGSGEGGIIRDQDVRAFSSTNQPDISFEWIELTPIQRTTGLRMMESVKTIPQFSVSMDIEVTGLMQMKERPALQDEQGNRQSPTFTALLVHTLGKLLGDFPLCNASFENDKIKVFHPANINVAIGTERGLFAPVLREADKKSISLISSELYTFRKKAVENSFAEEDLSGGTFTLSNLGMFGVDQFTAIVNPPQSAILAVGRTVEIAAKSGGQDAASAYFANFTLSADHRVMDGMYAAGFLSALKDSLAQLKSAGGNKG